MAHLYFATGGRRLNSFLFRVYHDPGVDAVDGSVPAPSSQQILRRSLEALHVEEPGIDALSIAWPYLNHGDRFVRYAARIAVEHQSLESWQSAALTRAGSNSQNSCCHSPCPACRSEPGPKDFSGAACD